MRCGALFRMFKFRHPEYSGGAMTEYLDFRKQYCAYEFSRRSQRRAAKLGLITFYCKLSSLLQVKTVTPREKRPASDDETTTSAKRRKTSTDPSEAQQIDTSDGETHENTVCSDPNNANDLFVQPTSIGSSTTPALDSGKRNLEGPGEVYHDHNEQSWNLLDLTPPPGYLQRLCSSFTLCYSTDLSPQQECKSEHLLLENPNRCSVGQPERSEVSLDNVCWDIDSVQTERRTDQAKQYLYRWADTWVSRPILDSDIFAEKKQVLVKQVKHSETIFILVRWKDSWVDGGHRIIRRRTPFDLVKEAMSDYNALD